MDLDQAFVSAVLAEGEPALKAARERGVRTDILNGAGKTAFDFIVEYVSLYKAMPEPGIVQGKTGMSMLDVKAPAAFFTSEVLNRALYEDLRKRYRDVIEHIEQVRPQEALVALDSMLKDIHATHRAGVSPVESIPKLFEDVMAYYDRIKAGERGILTPWDTINDTTLGFWPEDLAMFVARLGIGKTWTAALLGYHAWKNQHVVLFASTEISKLRVAMRFASIHFRVPYDALRKAKLDAFTEKKVRDGVTDIVNSQGLYVVGGDFDFRPEHYEAALREAQPHLSVFDGAYLLKTEGKDRMERAANAFNELKRICKRTSVPHVVTMQLNREAGQKGASADKIALTDVAGWNADLIFGLIQTEDMKRDRRMIMKPLKVREGEGEEFELNWNFETMDFTELPQAGKKLPGDAYDDVFSTGLDAVSGAAPDEVPF